MVLSRAAPRPCFLYVSDPQCPRPVQVSLTASGLSCDILIVERSQTLHMQASECKLWYISYTDTIIHIIQEFAVSNSFPNC